MAKRILVPIAHTPPAVTRLLFGSVAEQVARRAPMAVALVRPPTPRT